MTDQPKKPLPKAVLLDVTKIGFVKVTAKL